MTNHDNTGPDHAGHDEAGLQPVGAEGAQLKQKITQEKGGDQAKTFDPGASMLGTDNEAGAPPDADEMATARNAPAPR
jgi:hypothetical protein